MNDRIFSMRYTSLSEKKLISQHDSCKVIDKYDAMENRKAFLTYLNQKPVASVRLSTQINSKCDSDIPSIECFPKEIYTIIDANKTIAEISFLVLIPEIPAKLASQYKRLALLNVANEIEKSNTDCLIVAARKEEADFYRDLSFTKISEKKSIDGNDTVGFLMACYNTAAFAANVAINTKCLNIQFHPQNRHSLS